MASKSQKLTFEVTADSDQAKKALEALDRQSKLLEKGVEVPLTLEGAKEAQAQLDKAAQEARALATILQHTDAPGLDNVADEANRSAKELESMAREAKKVATAMETLDDQPGPDPDQLRRSADEMKTLERSSDGTKNALANLVGNSTQDLGELGGPLGSIGVAMGQVAEFTADAALEAGKLGPALIGAASVAGPVAGLAIALGLVMSEFSKMKARQEEFNRLATAQTKTLSDLTGGVEEWRQATEDAFGEGLANNLSVLGEALTKALPDDKMQKLAVATADLGMNLDDLGELALGVEGDFRGLAETQLRQAGMTEEQAKKAAELLDKTEGFKEFADVARKFGIDPNSVPRSVIEALDQLDKFGESTNLEDRAHDVLSIAAATSEHADQVKKAREETDNEADALQRYLDLVQEQNRVAGKAEFEQAQQAATAQRAADDLADATKGVADAEQAVADAADEAKRQQEGWLLGAVDLQGELDDVTSSIMDMVEQTKKQTEAGDEGAASFDGNTKAAIDNRKAFQDIVHQSVDVLDAYKKTGATAEEATKKQQDLAQSAYDTAIALGAPESVAARVRDTILGIPPSTTTDMDFKEHGLDEAQAKKDQVTEDTTTDLYFHGILDRGVIDAINAQGSGIFGRSASVSSAPASVSPSAGLQARSAPIDAPLAVAAPMASSRTRSVEVAVPVVVNVNAGIVADSFQLQRAVVRAGRSFSRIAGRRAAMVAP